LHHAGVHAPRLVVSTIPDAILKGTSNARLLRLVRRLWPEAKAIVTASGPTSAIELYEAGADFVFVSRLHSATQMASIVEQALDDDFAAVREAHIAQIRRRREVLA